MAAILTSLRHFRQGSSVYLKEFQRLLGLMASASAAMSSGLITHAPAAAMAEILSPLDEMRTSGRLSIVVTRGCIEALTLWRNPDLFSRGVPLGTTLTRGGHDGRIDSRLGSSVRGNASFGTVVGASEPVAHKPLGARSSLLSSKGVWTQLEQQHVLIRTDNTSVVSYIYHQGGIRSRALCKQAMNLLLSPSANRRRFFF